MNRRRGESKSYGHRNKIINIGDKGKEILEEIDDNCPLIQQFRGYSSELLEKHDRFERITKLNRDIAIESKRIIFLLHTIDKESKQEKVLIEAQQRLDTLKRVLFKSIACELENQDPYQYLRAYRNGLEEFIEALTFYQYLQGGRILGCEALQAELKYTIENESNTSQDDDTPSSRTVYTLVTPYDYILGIGDLTGELMRKCINNLATGDILNCYQTCNFVRNMYKGFLGCTTMPNKEINRKLYTLKQSLRKIENVCYTIKVRGSEIPKHILADVAAVDIDDDDEGYQAF